MNQSYNSTLKIQNYQTIMSDDNSYRSNKSVISYNQVKLLSNMWQFWRFYFLIWNCERRKCLFFVLKLNIEVQVLKISFSTFPSLSLLNPFREVFKNSLPIPQIFSKVKSRVHVYIFLLHIIRNVSKDITNTRIKYI